MRSFLLPFFVLFIFSCKSGRPVLTEAEFAKAYLDSLVNRYPDISFNLNPDLSISAKKDSLDFTNYVNNAYILYQQQPDSARQIITGYLNSTSDAFAPKKDIDIKKIVPIIKPVDYLDELNSKVNSADDIELVMEYYNSSLLILYAEDTDNSIKYLTKNDFKNLSISMDSLKSIAASNLKAILPEVQREGENGLYIISAGGYYDVSLILYPKIWTRESVPVKGDIIIAIPNRDILLVTGSENPEGLAKLKNMSADAYNTGTYPVSKFLFKWNGKKFEKFE